VFLILIISFPVMAESVKPDSVLYYKSGKDSVRVIFKRNEIYRTIYYFSNGRKLSEKTDSDRKAFLTNTLIMRSKRLTWNEEGKLLDKSKELFKERGPGHKMVVWTFRKNGRFHLKREQTGWSSKF
jgi:hypothetical protein